MSRPTQVVDCGGVERATTIAATVVRIRFAGPRRAHLERPKIRAMARRPFLLRDIHQRCKICLRLHCFLHFCGCNSLVNRKVVHSFKHSSVISSLPGLPRMTFLRESQCSAKHTEKARPQPQGASAARESDPDTLRLSRSSGYDFHETAAAMLHPSATSPDRSPSSIRDCRQDMARADSTHAERRRARCPPLPPQAAR